MRRLRGAGSDPNGEEGADAAMTDLEGNGSPNCRAANGCGTP
jgi:hypothetical protein